MREIHLPLSLTRDNSDIKPSTVKRHGHPARVPSRCLATPKTRPADSGDWCPWDPPLSHDGKPATFPFIHVNDTRYVSNQDTEAITFRYEKDELQGQPPPILVDVSQRPFDIYTNALHYLDTDSAKWPMIHVLIPTSRSSTLAIDPTQRHQPRPRLRGSPIRIVKVESIIFRASVARDDNIPVLALTLEHSAAGVCRAAVVDLHRGLAHLLVANQFSLARALE